ncbi:MAG: PAS domain-containing protein, partial [Candidatus Brocadia sp.]
MTKYTMRKQEKTKSNRQVENEGCIAVANGSEQKHHEDIATDVCLSHSILDQTMEGIVVCDVSGRIVRASKAAYTLCGGDPVSKIFEEAFPIQIKTGKKGYKNFRIEDVLNSKIIQGAEVSLAYSFGDCSDDTKVFHMLMNASPLRNAEKVVVGGIVILSDVTEQKRVKRRKDTLYT